SQGFKAGGFADRAQPDPEFDEEVNNAFELGMKASWLDGALTTNISIFRMKIRDLQVARSVFGAVNAFEVENAAEALSQGVEVDVAWSINENWAVGANFAYTDAEYQDFPNAVPAVGPAEAPVCRFGAGTPEVIQGVTSCNFAGQRLIFAPEFKGGLFVEYTRPNTFGEWTFGARSDVNFSSSFSTELTYNPNLEQDSYTLINASVRMTSPDERFTLSAIGRNLTEQHVIAWGFTGGFTDLVAPRAPREIILQARFNY
ncbi:MAG: TonB-dependent receptor, partial [Pseudomonadota bacterium]